MEQWETYIEQDRTLHRDTKKTLLDLLDLIRVEFGAVVDNPAKTFDEAECIVRGPIAMLQYSPDSRPSVKIWAERFQKELKTWRADYEAVRNGQAATLTEARQAREKEEEEDWDKGTRIEPPQRRAQAPAEQPPRAQEEEDEWDQLELPPPRWTQEEEEPILQQAREEAEAQEAARKAQAAAT